MVKFIIDNLLKIKSARNYLMLKAFATAYTTEDEMAKIEYVFSDSTGKKWYKYIKDEWMPLVRYDQMQARLKEIESRISRESLLLFSDALKKTAEAKDFLGIARLAKELEDRIENLYEPDLMVRFLSGILVREDQINQKVWNRRIENEKYEQIIKDYDDLSFFFQKCNLTKYVNFSDSSSSDLDFLTNPMIENQHKMSMLFKEMMKKVSNSFEAN